MVNSYWSANGVEAQARASRSKCLLVYFGDSRRREERDRGRVLERANAFYAGQDITLTRVMTDNGSCYRSRLFNDTLGEQIRHEYTRCT